MVESTLLVDAGFILVVGILYALVATRIRTRASALPSARALLMFRLWWMGISGLFLGVGVSGALHGLGVEDAAIHFALAVASILGLCAGFWGILYYVTYLFSGRTGAFYPYLAYCVGVFLVLVYGLTQGTTQAEAWRVGVSRLEVPTGPIMTEAVIALLVPVVIACAFYFSLYFRLDDPLQRYRVGLTSAGFIVWFGSAIVASLLGFADAAWWRPVGLSIGVGASLLVALAYFPPRTLREKSRRRGEAAPEVPL